MRGACLDDAALDRKLTIQQTSGLSDMTRILQCSWTSFHQELHMFRRLCVADSGKAAGCVPQIFGWGFLEMGDGQRPWICMEV